MRSPQDPEQNQWNCWQISEAWHGSHDTLSHAFPPATARSSPRPTVLSHRSSLSENRRCYRCAEPPLIAHRRFIAERAQHPVTRHHRCQLQRKTCKFNNFPLLLLLFEKGPQGFSKQFLLNTLCPDRQGRDTDTRQELQSPPKPHASHFWAAPGLWG